MLHYQQILKFCLAEIIHIKSRFGVWFFVDDSADSEKYVLYIL